MSQRVIDGHKETLEGGAESARRILKRRRPARHGRRLRLRLEPARRLRQGADVLRQVRRLHADGGARAAPRWTGAEIMGRGDEFGTLEAGKLADVLVVEGDVLADIRLLEDRTRFVAVVQGGVVKAGSGGYCLPRMRSSDQQPRTCGPGLRRWSRMAASVQPASSRASERTARRSNARARRLPRAQLQRGGVLPRTPVGLAFRRRAEERVAEHFPDESGDASDTGCSPGPSLLHRYGGDALRRDMDGAAQP